MKRIPLEDLKKQKYGRLVIIREVAKDAIPNKRGGRLMECLCECGNIKVVALLHLGNEHTTSCGCYAKTKGIIHGLRKHPLYTVWDNMKRRCSKPKASGYKDYGGRGIKVCNEWANDFKVFYDWAIANGWQKGLQIDRIDNDGHYEPSNCRFLTKKKNSQNQRRTVLSPETVEEIKHLRETKKWGRKKIADALGLTVGAVGGVIYNNTWQQ
ncbi:MAG: hypothetical protein RDU14_16890 [Melioribacteraceae bacterium]|nr:hypothetical protein [Melioribacteraceae bacterium]